MTSPSTAFDANRQATQVRLPGHRIVSIGGRDAVAFSQSQFCNDVAALADGQWQWNAWLSAKGRVIAIFMLQRENAERLHLLLPDHDPEALVAGLQRYVFRSKVTLTVEVGSFIAGTLGEAPQGAAAAVGDGKLRVDGTPLRHLQKVAAADFPGLPDGDALWRLLDIRHGIPRLPVESSEAYTAHMLGLDALGALALKKGCYPGQEVVARTHYLGRSKRSLQRLLLDGPGAAARHPLLAGGTAVGEIVVTAEHDGVFEALALLPTPNDDAPAIHALQVQAGDTLLGASLTAFLPGQRRP